MQNSIKPPATVIVREPGQPIRQGDIFSGPAPNGRILVFFKGVLGNGCVGNVGMPRRVRTEYVTPCK
jgi:hypothetical protein